MHKTPRIKFLLTALLALILFGVAAAQVDVTLKRYDIDDLGRSAGLIELSPNFLSIIEFEDAIHSASSGRSDYIGVTVDGQRVIVRPLRSVGSTDLIVQVDGKTVMFRVEIKEGNGTPRRYLIESKKPPTPVIRGESRGFLGERTPAPLPAATPAPAVEAEATTPQPALQAAVEPAAAPTESTIVEATSVEASSQGNAAAPAPATRPNQPDTTSSRGAAVPFNFTTHVASSDDTELVVNYTLTNQSNNVLANDTSRLRVLDDNDNPLEHTIVRMKADGTMNRVLSDHSEYGVIRLARPTIGSARIQWPIVEIGPGRTFTIDEVLHEIR